jgi:tRNA G18 (ribose-2'-O)-methylase SpoU
MSKRGYCAIGMFEPKTLDNLGVLFRSAHLLGADFVFTIGNRYRRQFSDTSNTLAHVPYFAFVDMDDFLTHLPQPRHEVSLIAVEVTEGAEVLETFVHPERAIYVLGGEDRTLSGDVLAACDSVVRFTSKHCLNVSVSGSIVLYDRQAKQLARGA